MVRKNQDTKTEDDLRAKRLIYDGSEKLHIDHSEAEGEPYDLMAAFEEEAPQEKPSGAAGGK